MERPKLFENGVIPDTIKTQNDGVIAAKRERITEDAIRLKELKEQYDIHEGNPENGGYKSDLREKMLELKLNIALREEEVRRYEEDPNLDFLVGKIEREEIKRKVMEEMGYSEKMLGYQDLNIQSLKKREAQS
jgi:hypothetical protein